MGADAKRQETIRKCLSQEAGVALTNQKDAGSGVEQVDDQLDRRRVEVQAHVFAVIAIVSQGAMHDGSRLFLIVCRLIDSLQIVLDSFLDFSNQLRETGVSEALSQAYNLGRIYSGRLSDFGRRHESGIAVVTDQIIGDFAIARRQFSVDLADHLSVHALLQMHPR